jgi:hypothetical protein
MARAWVGLACLVAACSGSDEPPTLDEPAWQLLNDTPASLMSVWGPSDRDIWGVGGRTEIAGAPTVARYDGDRWTTVDAGVTGVDLWWVFGVPGSDTVYFGGSKGTILRYRGGAFTPMPTPGGAAIVFGIWGASDTDLWAVGSENGAGFAWRGDGTSWTPHALPTGVTGRLFKVHGQSAQDVWISAVNGSTLHWNGSELAHVPTGQPWSLFAIITTPDRVVAVGGSAEEGAILEYTGSAWVPAPSILGTQRALAAHGDTMYALGEFGTVARRDANGWIQSTVKVSQKTFHAAWADSSGGVWGVGGDFDRVPLSSAGFLTYFGTKQPRSIE